jgi:tRNA threonylcarbamoyladenosine dehydratase
VVYSTEVPGDVKLLPLPEEEFQKGDVKELGVLDDFRVRILPVLGMFLLVPCICSIFVKDCVLEQGHFRQYSVSMQLHTSYANWLESQ